MYAFVDSLLPTYFRTTCISGVIFFHTCKSTPFFSDVPFLHIKQTFTNILSVYSTFPFVYFITCIPYGIYWNL